MDKVDKRDFDSHYEYWDKIKGAKHKFYEAPEKRAFTDITECQDKLGGEMSEYATELDYLKWFYNNCDFGPAHEDVLDILREDFEEETGKKVPVDYCYDSDEED